MIMEARYIFLAPCGRLPSERINWVEMRSTQDVAQDDEDVLGRAAEGVDGRVGQAAGDEVEGQVEVGEREVGEDELDELVDEFDVQEHLARDGVVGEPDLLEVDKRVDGGEEGAVEPAAALRDELGDGVWGQVSKEQNQDSRNRERAKLTRHVRLASATLDIL